ncbi:unnamed protein product [Macrosiphum euphorbiae]|uniref:HTH psq-type domain-containing protein n=1 Tax=Macrosiphum euphorbiae TaxID=13131 RepID=A0AAV0WH27_9HEMI|nr:unnamed protein product [Macrosiphum euphorbiae]
MASKPKFEYNIQDMQKAVHAVQNKELIVYKASLLYNVPRSSLKNSLDGKTTIENRKLGPPPALGDHEILLVNWIETMSKRGFPIVSRHLLVSVGKIAKKMGIDHLLNILNPSKK